MSGVLGDPGSDARSVSDAPLVGTAVASLAWVNGAAALLTVAYLVLLTRYYIVDRDFSVYYHAAEAAKAGTGTSPYHLPGYVFLYGPIFLLLVRPLLAVGESQARFVWFVVQCVVLTAFVRVCIRESRSLLARRWWGIVFLCTAMARPTHDDLTLGQIGIFIAFLTVASFPASGRGRPAVAGLLLALATSIKFSPVFVCLHYVQQKRWAVVRWIVAGSVLLLATTLIVYGLDLHLDAVRKLASGAAYPLLAEHNDSLYALVLRMFSENRFVHPLIDAPRLGYALIAASAVFVLGACIFSATRSEHGVWNFNLWLLAMILLYPASGLYSLVVLLLPALTIARDLEERPHAGVATVLIVAVALLYVPPMNGLVDVAQLESRWMSICCAPQAFSVILLFILSVRAVGRTTRSARSG